jgi:hypothetical protein
MNVYRVLVGKPQRKPPLGRPRRTWEDNIKMDKRNRMGVKGIDLAQDRNQWRAPVNMIMNLWVPLNVGKFLSV